MKTENFFNLLLGLMLVGFTLLFIFWLLPLNANL